MASASADVMQDLPLEDQPSSSSTAELERRSTEDQPFPTAANSPAAAEFGISACAPNVVSIPRPDRERVAPGQALKPKAREGAFGRLHAEHARKAEQLKQLREKADEQECELARQLASRTTRVVKGDDGEALVQASANRLYADAVHKRDRLLEKQVDHAKQAEWNLKQEQNRLRSCASSPGLLHSCDDGGYMPRWEQLHSRAAISHDRLEHERQCLEEQQRKWMESHSIHRPGAAKSCRDKSKIFDRLHNEAHYREARRDEERKEKELRVAEIEEQNMVHRKVGLSSVATEKLCERLHTDAGRRRQRLDEIRMRQQEELQQQSMSKSQSACALGPVGPGVGTARFELLYSDASRREEERRLRKAQVELEEVEKMKQQSVHSGAQQRYQNASPHEVNALYDRVFSAKSKQPTRLGVAADRQLEEQELFSPSQEQVSLVQTVVSPRATELSGTAERTGSAASLGCKSKPSTQVPSSPKMEGESSSANDSRSLVAERSRASTSASSSDLLGAAGIEAYTDPVSALAALIAHPEAHVRLAAARALEKAGAPQDIVTAMIAGIMPASMSRSVVDGVLAVRVVAVHRLPNARASDIYIRLRVGSTVYRTKAANRSANPRWDAAAFEFHILPDEDSLLLQVLDENPNAKGSNLGKAVSKFRLCKPGEWHSRKQKLEGGKFSDAELEVELRFLKAKVAVGAASPSLQLGGAPAGPRVGAPDWSSGTSGICNNEATSSPRKAKVAVGAASPSLQLAGVPAGPRVGAPDWSSGTSGICNNEATFSPRASSTPRIARKLRLATSPNETPLQAQSHHNTMQISPVLHSGRPFSGHSSEATPLLMTHLVEQGARQALFTPPARSMPSSEART